MGLHRNSVPPYVHDLADDAVAEVGHARRLEHADELESGLARLEAVEQALTRSEDHGVHLQVDLVDDPRVDSLPGARRTAGDGDRPVASRRLACA